MKKSNLIKLVALLLILNSSLFCLAQQYKVDITKAIIKDIPLSAVLLDFKTVDLVIPDGVEVKNVSVYYLKDGKYLVVKNLKIKAYLFDNQGRFINEINGDYTGNTYSFYPFVDVKRNFLYTDNLNEWIGIDILTNKVTKRVVKPKLLKDQIANFIQLSKNEYMGYVNNQTGNCNTLFAVFDVNGKILWREPNNKAYTKVNVDSPFQRGLFYQYESHYYCLEPLMGTTVYEVGDNILSPHIYFYAGDKTPIYEYQDLNRDNLNNKDEWKLSLVRETETRIYFTYVTAKGMRWGYYDKKEEQAYITPELPRTTKSDDITDMNLRPSFIQDQYSVKSKLKGDTLKLVIGKFK